MSPIGDDDIYMMMNTSLKHVDNDDSIRCIKSPTFNDARARVKIRKIISTVAIEYYCIFIF